MRKPGLEELQTLSFDTLYSSFKLSYPEFYLGFQENRDSVLTERWTCRTEEPTRQDGSCSRDTIACSAATMREALALVFARIIAEDEDEEKSWSFLEDRASRESPHLALPVPEPIPEPEPEISPNVQIVIDLLDEYPNQWTMCQHSLTHTDGLQIWLSNGDWGVYVELPGVGRLLQQSGSYGVTHEQSAIWQACERWKAGKKDLPLLSTYADRVKERAQAEYLHAVADEASHADPNAPPAVCHADDLPTD